MKFGEMYPKTKIVALIVDPQVPMRRAYCRVLTEMGVEQIEECSTGEEAVRKLERLPQINLVITELHTEKVSGFDITTYIRTRPALSEIPVLVVSGDLNREVVIKARACGIDDFCAKPLMSGDLKRKIWTVVGSYLRPSPGLRLMRQGDELFVANRYYESLAVYRDAKIEMPDSPAPGFAVALTFWKLGQEGEAIRLLIKNSRSYPLYYKNFALLADIYLRQKKLHKALEYMKKELAINPRQPHRLALLGRIHLKMHKFRDAEEWFRRSVAESSRYEKGMWGLCYALFRMEEFERCLQQIRKIRKFHPKNKNSLELLMAIGKNPEWSKSVEMLLKEEISRTPGHLMLYLCLSKYYFMTRDYHNSLEVMKKFLHISPENQEVVRFMEAIRKNSPVALNG